MKAAIWYLVSVVFFSLALSLLWYAFVSAQSLPAQTASGQFKTPTWKEVVEAFMRVSVSEAGFTSEADERLIRNVFVTHSGGGESVRRKAFMVTMAAIANRTFPEGSPFVPVGHTAASERHQWVAGINFDCTEPAAWREHNDVPWAARHGNNPSYRDLCVALRRRTWARLSEPQKPADDWCEAHVDYWGSEQDSTNPTAGHWLRVNCDRPAARATCAQARAADPQKPHLWPDDCTKNIGWCMPGRGLCPGGR